MKTAKMNRRALLMSVISLILCCAMLIGTTLAWFTDSVSSANNVIKAGNLDVELYYKNDVQTDYTPVKVDTNIFKTETLWEPGHTEVVKLKVANLGSLALKYQLGINIVSETGSVNMEGKEFLVSDYIKFAVIEGDKNYTREEAVAAAEAANAKPIKSGYNGKTTQLLATKSEEVTVVVYMPETVGNEANHGYGKAQPVITLGLNLFATQVENESDSFGNNYDENAWVDGFDVFNEQDLNAAIANGETAIDVMANIMLTEAVVIPEGSTVTMNLNGNNIDTTAAYVESNATASSAVVNNGTLKLIGNGTIKATNNYTVRNYGTMVINGVTIENGIMNFADLTVKSGNISNSRSGKHTIYGNNAKLTIDGGTFYNGNPGNAAIFSYTGEVEINGGEFSIADGTATLGWTSCLLDAQGNAKFTINGGVIKGEIRDYNKNTTVYGGTFTHNSAKNFIATGYKAVDNANGTYTVMFPQSSFEDLIENAQPGETVNVPAGNFTMSGNNDLVIVGSGKDTVITFPNSIGNANISNATISGEPRLAVKSGESAVFNNVNFEGTKAWGSVQGTAKFVGCTFNGLLHIDSSAETTTIKFVDCTFGEYSIIKLGGSAKYILEDCTVEKLAADATGAWGKEWLITYCDTTFNECTLGRVIRAGKTININLNNCVDADGNAVSAGIVHKNAAPNVFINGVEHITAANSSKPVAALTEDFLFPAGTDAVMYKNAVLTGDAQIVHTENVVLGLSNINAELDHDVIVRKSGGAICIENSNFTLTDGAKLITVGEGGDGYQVFLVNVTVNGELLTRENAGKYLEGISWFEAISEWPNVG